MRKSENVDFRKSASKKGEVSDVAPECLRSEVVAVLARESSLHIT